MTRLMYNMNILYSKDVNTLNTDVEEFLYKCRELIDRRQVDLFLNDPENRSTMDLIGYNPRALLQELKELEASDLHEGPVDDDNPDRTGQVWIFKKYIHGIRIYIKLKIRKRRNEDVFLMSFHPDR